MDLHYHEAATATGEVERETLLDSLNALGTDYVDLWLIHWPHPVAQAGVDSWRASRPRPQAGRRARSG